MSYNHPGHSSGSFDDEENVPETRGLLQETSSDLDSNEHSTQPTTSHQRHSTVNMGFKDWTSRIAFLQGHAERSPLEKDLVRRLDIFLMTFGCSKSSSTLSHISFQATTF